MDAVSRNEFIDDLITPRTVLGYTPGIISSNPGDVLDALSLVCRAVDKTVFGVNCSALGSGFELASGPLSAVGVIANGLEAIDNGVNCVSNFSTQAVIDLSDSLAKTVRDAAKTASFFEAVEAIQRAPWYTTIVAEGASIVSSVIGFGNNIAALFEPMGTDPSSNARWWKNATEAGANSLAVALSVIALLGLVLAEAYTLAIATAFLVCVFASYVFTKDLEQIGFAEVQSINKLEK